MSTTTTAPSKKAARRSKPPARIPIGILVDRQIRRARELHLLDIDPFEPRCLEPATYDVPVGDMAAVSTASAPIDLKSTELLTIEPGAMAIVQSLEVFKLSNQIVCRIGPKSSLLRRGIIAATGPQIDPGYHGRLIVNLINLSPRTFVVRHADPFLSIEFHYLSEAPDHPYKGEYQDRMGLSPEELEILFAYQGPTLAEIYRGFSTIRDHIKEIAGLKPELSDTREQIYKGLIELRETVLHAGASRPQQLALLLHDAADPSYQFIKPISVIVQLEEGAYLASFFDANIHASGDTDQEAFDNLRAAVLDTYEAL